ncbi:PHP domain-containing protein [Arundinibacter roseus]|uniref:DNA polymerase/3'-5' exonuclease PolX n=1 Tax=Arundinibacter roseus TaxID=2070510 RepID=A0A4R4K5U2_9BACT|nr:PHP domain-containing protein [Arundinibacter roseus]TDB61861.1 DNA polymerase/3'-5' exonuclease PolX [Arundinibacter roseus]
MTNSEIIDTLELTARLLELHGADSFKVRAYGVAAFNLDKLVNQQIAELAFGDLVALQGVGKKVAEKIRELVEKGSIQELNDLLAQTPPGVLEMFQVKGIGPKKIAVLWRELGIESLHELEIACQNGSIAALKGFGGSTQQKILDSLAFMRSQAGKLRMDKAEMLGTQLLESLEKYFDRIEIAGQLRRKTETVDTLLLLIAHDSPVAVQATLATLDFLIQDKKNSTPFVWRGKMADHEIAVELACVPPLRMEAERFLQSSAEAHLALTNAEGRSLLQIARTEPIDIEEDIYKKAGFPFIVPEMREGHNELEWAQKYTTDALVTWQDLKGILHNHSTYSDGQHSLKQMADFCRELGFEYLGIADHSQTAAYANGLKAERVLEQQREIEQLNAAYAQDSSTKPFKILKGIESDILGDGSLDYPAEILSTFDYVVASVHSNLSMTLEKATTRLLRAIENPYTTILGHPTGRLLLSRDGYPIDHRVIIDACAAHGVVIEINASPWRLDLDWRWIRYCLEKGVQLSINPDAHEMDGYYDMHYGVAVARKGGLPKTMTFNALSLQEMEAYLAKRRI